MYQLSDSDSKDSDEGVRFKTESIRDKYKHKEQTTNSRSNYKSKSPERRGRSKEYRNRERDSHRKKDNYRDKESSRKHHRKHSSSDEESNRKINRPDSKEKNRYSREKDLKRKSSSRSRKSEDRNKEKSRKSEDINEKTEECKEIPLGPSLPPHLLKKTEERLHTEPSCSKLKEIGCNVQGPTLPPHLLKPKSFEKNVVPEENKSLQPDLPSNFPKKICNPPQKDLTIGPALPPHLLNIKPAVEDEQIEPLPLQKHLTIGPALPSHLLKPKPEEENMEEQSSSQVSCIGPALPTKVKEKLLVEHIDEFIIEDSIEDSEEEVYGPLPDGFSSFSKAHIALEERALQIKLDKLNPNDDKQPVREEWMIELPAAKSANFGLGPRQFRSKAGPDLSNRSQWTDTPEIKEKRKKGEVIEKVDLQKEAEMKARNDRDKEQEAMSKRHKKYKESLVEMHEKKLKKEKKKSGMIGERKPFNRETDLQVNKFDEAQKKAVLKKAQLLDDRFSRGDSKFL